MVVAARLCAAAASGQILAAQVVKLMIGAHAAQSFVDVGALELKGLSQPVDAVEGARGVAVPIDPRRNHGVR